MTDAETHPSEPGPAFYFDGSGARRQAVNLQLREAGLAILSEGREIAFGRFADLRDADSPAGILRIGAEGAPELARVEVRDAAMQKAILAHELATPQTRRRGGRGANRPLVARRGAVGCFHRHLPGAARRRPACSVHSVRDGAAARRGRRHAGATPLWLRAVQGDPR